MEKEISKKEEKVVKKKLNIKRLAILLVAVIAIICAFVFIIKKFNKEESYKDKATYSTAFFIKNNKGKYALFNESGKKLTNFIYDSANSFVNNAALVYKEKEGYAVINQKGKDIVSFGDYNYISAYSGLYKVRSEKGYKIIDSKGKTIIDAEELDISSYGDEYPFSIITANNEVKIISYDAKTIKTFKKDKAAKTPTVNHVGKIATVFYNGENVVFNAKTKKIIATFKNQNHFCVNNISEDEKILTLNACASWFESVSEPGHMVIVDGKVNDLSKKCDNLSLYDDTVVCSSSSGDSLIEISGKTAKIGAKITGRTAFIDSDNYATRDEKSYKVVFYKNGKKVKSIDASISSSGKMQSDLYVLYVDNGYEFYNKEGKRVIKENFKYASAFDKNGLAKVSKDGKSYYLINEKGKKVSNEYSSINNYEEYYQVTNNKNLKGVINKKGDEIVPTKYASVNIKSLRDKYYAVTSTDSGKYFLYDLDNNKLIKETKNIITLNEHYIKVSGDKKTSYYTYKDKLIYEEK